MAGSYKLYYFEMRNRAEPIRVLLHYVGQPFEDVKYSFGQWPSVKASEQLFWLPSYPSKFHLFFNVSVLISISAFCFLQL